LPLESCEEIVCSAIPIGGGHEMFEAFRGESIENQQDSSFKKKVEDHHATNPAKKWSDELKKFYEGMGELTCAEMKALSTEGYTRAYNHDLRRSCAETGGKTLEAIRNEAQEWWKKTMTGVPLAQLVGHSASCVNTESAIQGKSDGDSVCQPDQTTYELEFDDKGFCVCPSRTRPTAAGGDTEALAASAAPAASAASAASAAPAEDAEGAEGAGGR
jgi:hypothetical protein